MPNEDLIHIKISRTIPAEKWRVIRLVTKVAEFPSYIATVKQAGVIEKTHNKIKTKWQVQVDGVPISWIEEDTLDLKENKISFMAVEGDLRDFKGEWTFEKTAEGTVITINIYFNVGVPLIHDFASPYIKDMLAKNFETILEAIENRLISTKYSSFKKGVSKKIAGFAILGHFYNFNHLARSLKMLNPDFKMPSREFLGKLFGITPSFKIHDIPEFKSKTGETTFGCIIACTFIPDMLTSDIHAVYSKVIRACRVAEKNGMGIVTLGGFASMVAERFGNEIADEVDIPITTGNTYTSALAIDGVEKAAELLGLELRNLKLTIVGGTGDIGSACARVLSERVKQITITGRTKSNLRLLGAELKKKRKAKVEITANNKKAVKDADIVIAAANTSASILDIGWFKPGAIICDLAYPKNISYASTNRKDILIFSGGLAKIPTPIDSGFDLGLPVPYISYGCFSEVIILALEHRYENFSYGRGKITTQKIEEIRNLALKHGFELAPFFWADKMLEQEDIEQIKKAGKKCLSNC